MLMWIAQQGKCWLCGLKMPKPIKGGPPRCSPPPEYPTRDHIKPVSEGGTNSYENLMLAHRKCNEKRGNRQQVVSIEPHPKVIKATSE